MLSQTYDFTIEQGKYTRVPVRWADPRFVYKPITGILAQAPVRITAVDHGLTDGWPVAVVSVKGMTEINAALDSTTSLPKSSSYKPVTVIDDDTVELNSVNAAEFSAYTSGGYLQFYQPVDLNGYSARMQIRDKGTGDLLVELTTDNGGIEIDPAQDMITLIFGEDETVGDTWVKGIYDLELVDPLDRPYGVIRGRITLLKEVTV